jgi:hypothetical protein
MKIISFLFFVLMLATHITAQVTQEWVATYNGPGNTQDIGKSIVVDSEGNVYVTGDSREGNTSMQDYVTTKYNSSGVQQWVARYNGPGNDQDEVTSLSVDNSGNVYVTGKSSAGAGLFSDYATIKYNSSGVEQWVARYNGPGNDNDWAFSLAVDAAGNVYVTGSTVGPAQSTEYATIKYNSSGVEQWVATYDGPENSADEAYSIVIDNEGNVYVTGGSYGLGTFLDYATIKYNSSGVEQWVARYNGPGPENGVDAAKALAIDNEGNVYVTGYSYDG